MTVVIINGNSLHIPLADKSVHCIVSSPPYWGLRDYGTGSWEGGDPACDHLRPRLGGNGPNSPINGGGSDRDEAVGLQQYKDVCKKCGAHRIDNQLGQERVPDCLGWATGVPCGECFVCHMVQVFRECWRVLRDDGTLWLNLGDSHNGSGGPGHQYDNKAKASFKGEFQKFDNPNRLYKGLKPKDLVGIPWRVAFALQADGWYLRMDNIWSKPNPMPESVRDRPTKSHEYLFLFSKSRKYFYDQDAVREPNADPERTNYTPGSRSNGINPDRTDNDFAARYKANHKNLRPDGQRPNSMHVNRANGEGEPEENPNGRNKWSVWTIATRPYPGSHFATYPPELVEPCIKAGTSEKGCCPKCGKPWERIVKPSERYKQFLGRGYHDHSADEPAGMMQMRGGGSKQSAIQKAGINGAEYVTVGWQPTCKCGIETTKPCIVFDPFSGSGTTVMVARALGRDGVGLDLSMKYIQECAMERLGLDDLKEWMEGKKAEVTPLSDLPMFAGLA